MGLSSQIFQSSTRLEARRLARRITVEGYALVPPRQFIRISGRLKGKKGRNSTSRGCKIEVGRVQTRSLECCWATFGVAGHSLRHPGGVLELSCGGLKVPGGRLAASWGPGGRLWGVLGSPWRHLKPSWGVLTLLVEAKSSIPSYMFLILKGFCFKQFLDNRWNIFAKFKEPSHFQGFK